MKEHQKKAIEALQSGSVVENYKEGGNSMTPIIKSRQPVKLEPVDASTLERGDIVFVKVNGNLYTHKVTATRNGMVQIGNNHGYINGWTKLENVYGIVTEVDGREIGSAKEKVIKNV
jgi:hypothetical protein